LSAQLPNFLILGAQKAGTHWLRRNLAKHPEVYLSGREINYFNCMNLWRGLDWYAGQFDPDGEPHVGECSPRYMLLSPGSVVADQPAEIAERVDETLSGVRLLAILRNPVDRAYSAYLHHVRHGRLPATMPFFRWVMAADPAKGFGQIVPGGWYHASLAPYAERFGDRLLVVLTDDVIADGAGTYRRLLEHLGADPEFVPEDVDEVVHSTPAAEGPNRVADGSRVPLTPAQRKRLAAFFADDVERLSTLLDRDLRAWLR
jgi:hypothetical protein